jgi:alpha-D-ribose 1-methylphosphonate 5-triphosphate diphosphatase
VWLVDLQIVLPERTVARGALRIEEGRIADIVEGEGPLRTGTVVQGEGLIALPGIIDMHGDMFEIEAEPRPGAHFPLDMALFELDKRLAANGITTAYAAISFWETLRRGKQRSGERAAHMIGTIHALRDQLLIDLRIHARYEVTTPAVAPLLRDLLDQRQIHLLSLMDHTPGQGQYRDLEQYVAFMADWRNADPQEVERETIVRMEKTRQDTTIWSIAAELVERARAQGLALASHDDDTQAKIELMARLGVTISEFPVRLDAAQAAHARGLAVVMGAPNLLRGGSHTGNLSARAAIEAGLVDLLAADYAPAALLQAPFLLAQMGILPLHEASKLVSQNVADALGLHERGRIAPGYIADLILVEAGPRPRLRGTLRAGLPIYWDGALAQRMHYSYL